jgi:hypothetical protein
VTGVFRAGGASVGSIQQQGGQAVPYAASKQDMLGHGIHGIWAGCTGQRWRDPSYRQTSHWLLWGISGVGIH